MKKKLFVSMLLLLSLAAALIFCLSACREPEVPPAEETLMTCYECADKPVMKHYPYVAPTCKSTGRSEYWECEVCNAAYIKYRDQAMFAPVTELTDYVVLPALPHTPDFAVTETTHSMTRYRCGCPLEGERIEGAHQMDALGRCEICSYQEGSPEVTYRIDATTGEAIATGFSADTLPEELRFASHYEGARVTKIQLYTPNEEKGSGILTGEKKRAWRTNSVKTLVIPYTVKTIRYKSFYDFTALENVVFAPNAELERLEGECFAGCTALTAISIPKSVRWIETGVYPEYDRGDGCCPPMYIGYSSPFSGCTALRSITLPVDGCLFRLELNGCTALSELYLPANGHLNQLWLSGCTALTALTVPAGVESIYFAGCSSLSSVVLPEGVKEIPDNAFLGCTALGAVTLPEGALHIGAKAFAGCTALASIYIPESVTTVGERVFEGCTALAAIHIPESVTTVGEHVFEGCDVLSTIEMPAHLYETGKRMLAGCTGLVELTVPKGVTVLTDGLLAACVNLTSVTLPEGLHTISDNVFGGCTALHTVRWPESLTAIGAYAFRSTALTTLHLPEAFSTVYTGAFSDCKELVEVTLPAMVTRLENRVFANCTALQNVQLQEGLVYIGESAFSGCASLGTVTLPASLRSIGLYAFGGCDALSFVHFSDTVGWQFATISTAGGIDLDVSDTAQNAAYLTDRYVGYSLNKKNLIC